MHRRQEPARFSHFRHLRDRGSNVINYDHASNNRGEQVVMYNISLFKEEKFQQLIYHIRSNTNTIRFYEIKVEQLGKIILDRCIHYFTQEHLVASPRNEDSGKI